MTLTSAPVASRFPFLLLGLEEDEASLAGLCQTLPRSGDAVLSSRRVHSRREPSLFHQSSLVVHLFDMALVKLLNTADNQSVGSFGHTLRVRALFTRPDRVCLASAALSHNEC